VPVARWLVQLFFLGLTLVIALQFAAFFEQARGGGPVTTGRPPGVEAYLPLSALLAFRRLIETGRWDFVHPAGLTFFVAVLAGAVVARRAFCAGVCPVGLAGRVLERVRAKVLRLPARFRTPAWLRWPFLGLKYLFLAAFVFQVWTMPLDAIEGFILLPYNRAADANMLQFVLHMSAVGIAVVLTLVALSLVVRNAWCRFACPYGALLGLLGLGSPFRVTRDPEACADCGACARACPAGIPVDRRRTVATAECTACASCVAACRVEGALSMRAAGRKVPAWLPAVLAVATIAAAWAGTVGTRYWETSLSVRDFAEVYRTGLKER
jgi:polyferredoxin